MAQLETRLIAKLVDRISASAQKASNALRGLANSTNAKVGGVEYRVITPRLRGGPKDWSAYDKRADVLQRLVQTAAILCVVPEAVLLELDGDDFTALMDQVADMTLKFAEQSN